MQESISNSRENAQVEFDKIDAASVAADVEYLSSDALAGRDTGSKGINLAAYYLQEQFQQMKIEPFFESYRDLFQVEGKDAFNVVAMLPGTDREMQKEIVVIGAHYDHIGMVQAVAGDSIANGANDNATGTATVMAMAKILKQADFNRRTVVFALFSAEEKGLLGSKHLAQRMKQDGHDVVAMLNFEMTGTPMVNRPYLAYLTGHDLSNMAEVFNTSNIQRQVTGKLDQAATYNLFMRSDNYPFYNAFQVPAQTFSTFDFTNFDHYHKVGDEFALVDTSHMAELINALMPGVFAVVNGDRLIMKPTADE